MQNHSDAQLLRQYAAQRSEAAFSEIVARHAGLVYSAALRQLDSPDLARDVAQSVFTDLARKSPSLADKLSGDTSLAGWLYRSTRFAARDWLRGDRRRQARERQVMEHFDATTESSPEWERMRPCLDEAMAELSDEDREAVLLRYFEKQDLHAVGKALGVSEDAAQKRVSRALERLHIGLTSRGVTTTAGALSALLAANTVSFAPAGLAATLSTAALAGTTLATAATATVTKAFAMTTLQKALIAAAFTAAVGTGIYEARQISRLRSENQNLIAQQETLTGERDKAFAAAAGKDNELERLQKDKNALLRLRGEVGQLRRQTNELGKLREANRQLQAALPKPSQPAQPADPDTEDTPERQAAYAKMNDAKMLVLALMLHASVNQDRLPTDLSQTTNYLGNGEYVLTGTNQFELVVQGSLKNVTNPMTTIVVREKEISILNGRRVKAYGFADGHSEIKSEPLEGFDAWENQHMLPSPTGP